MRALVEGLSGSLIRHIANAAMDRPGVIPLWFGESDQPTAPAIRMAAQASLEQGETLYSANLGLPVLRRALADYQRDIFGSGATHENIAVTSSALSGLFLALSAIVDPGDEVVVLTPTWPNIPAIPQILSATVVAVPLRLSGTRFVLDMDELLRAIGPKTRAVLINSPQNPTGWRMETADMQALVDHLDRRGIWLVADEVYARVLHDGRDVRSFLGHVDDRVRIMVVNSFSKTWAMTGWRLGWITAPAHAIERLEQLIEFNTSCSPVFVQRGGIAALGPAGEAFVVAQQARLAAARAVVQEVLGADDRFLLPDTDATFYQFPRVRGLSDGVAYALRAIEAGVGIAPGEAFGTEAAGHIRLCYARDPVAVRTACERLLGVAT